MRLPNKTALVVATYFFLNITTASAAPGWEPVFVDNFNGRSVDTRKWVTSVARVERQLAQHHRSAVSVSNGTLRLRTFAQSRAGKPYTSGAIKTQGLFRQKHGYFEMRARMPQGEGFWPTFWLKPSTGRWTSEIDIAEYTGDKPNRMNHAFHYDRNQRNQHTKLVNTGIHLGRSFNTYAVHWSPNRLDYYINGERTHTVSGGNVVRSKANDSMFLILSMHLVSQHQRHWSKSVNSATNINNSLEVDYVRVYKWMEGGRYNRVPGHSTSIADSAPPEPYDQTALSFDTVTNNTPAIFRSPTKVADTLRITSHADNLNARVTLHLQKVTQFRLNGDVVTESSQPSQIHNVNFTRAGQSRDIRFEFDAPREEGVYHLTAFFKDGENINRGGSAIREYQYIRSSNRTAFFDGFVKASNATYSNGRVTINSDIQLHEAALSEHLNINYTVVERGSNNVMARANGRWRHSEVGLQRNVTQTIPVELDPNGNYDLRVDVRDSSTRISLPRFTAGITTNSVRTNKVSVRDEPPGTTSSNGATRVNKLFVGDHYNRFAFYLNVSLAPADATQRLKYRIELYPETGAISGATRIASVSGQVASSQLSSRTGDHQLFILKSLSGIPTRNLRARVYLYKDKWNRQILQQDTVATNVSNLVLF